MEFEATFSPTVSVYQSGSQFSGVMLVLFQDCLQAHGTGRTGCDSTGSDSQKISQSNFDTCLYTFNTPV